MGGEPLGEVLEGGNSGEGVEGKEGGIWGCVAILVVVVVILTLGVGIGVKYVELWPRSLVDFVVGVKAGVIQWLTNTEALCDN